MIKFCMIRRISGSSMDPTLQSGQVVIVLKRTHYNPGDVVMLFHDGIEKVKRINSILPSGECIVIGDNARKSTDSRHFGAIDSRQIIGKVFWPRV